MSEKYKYKVRYENASDFALECARLDVIPLIHWRQDDLGVTGFIYFLLNDECHIFLSDNKKLLNAIWNSVGLIRHAIKLVDEV